MDIGFYQTYFAVEKKHWLMRVRRAIMHDQLTRFLAPLASKKILDVGSGSGMLIGELQQLGIDAYGIDSSAEAIAYGTKEGVRNLSVMPSTNKLPYPEAHFDAVLAMDVLEHLRDESDALSEFTRVLKKDGMLFVTVPAYMFLWGKQDEVSQHFRRYTMGGMIELFRTDGNFEIVRRSYFNTFLFPLVCLVRIGSRIFNRAGRGSDFDLNNGPVNAICFFIFDLERRLLKYVNFPFGVSILLVLKKNT